MNEDRRHLPAGYAAIVAMGAFSAWFASFKGMGKLPFQFLLKDRLGVSPTGMAGFFFVAGLALHLKPVAGLVSDRARSRGARRPWLWGSALSGAALWAAIAVVPVRYGSLLAMAVAINAAAAIADAVTGGLLVDEGMARGGAGRMVAIREGALNAAVVLSWALGGWLSGRAQGLLGLAGAVPLLALALASGRWLHEAPPAAGPPPATARALLSGPFVRVAGVIFLFAAAPGFETTLYFYRRDVLGLGGLDVGLLSMLNGTAGMLAAVVYARLSRRLTLPALLACGIALNAVSSLFYLAYRTVPLAALVEVANGFAGTLGIVAIQHLAARASPRGREALGYSLLLGVEGLGSYLSDLSGTYLGERFGISLFGLAVINAGGTALALLALPLLAPSLRGRDVPG